jgi:hypothetical protein
MPSPPNKADITENAHLAGAEFNIACALPGQSLALRFDSTPLDLPSNSRLIGAISHAWPMIAGADERTPIFRVSVHRHGYINTPR